MAWRECVNAGAVSEFGAYNGDCMWDAMLSALHVLPLGLPLDLAELNAITARAIREGKAGANGAATISAVRDALVEWYGLQPVAFVPYTEPLNPATWQQLVRAYAGTHPVELLVANGGALFDNERGIHYHGVSVLAGDSAMDVYGVANGDSTTCRDGSLSRYTMADLEAAQPVGVLVFPAAAATTGGGVALITREADGTAKDTANGRTVGRGLADCIFQNAWQGEDLSVGERDYGGGYSCAATTNHIVWWDSHTNTAHTDRAGEVLRSIFGQLDAATAEVQTLTTELDAAKQQPAPAPAPAPAPDPNAVHALALVAALKEALA